MANGVPKVDERSASEIVGELREMARHYTPEWRGAEGDGPGVALVQLFSFIAGEVIRRLNRAPRKNFVAFLDMLGIELLPARPARVPIHFRLAAGTEGPLLVPTATQCTADATDVRPALPFETEEDLWAIYASLTEVVAVDPADDAIYKAPRVFLEQELPAPIPAPYRIVSFSAADSSSFQLDRVDELAEGDALRLRADPAGGGRRPPGDDCRLFEPAPGAVGGAEHVIVASLSGEIVTVTDKLARSYSPDTPVEKVTRFHLFDSKNLQEHILYLGHPEQFAVKSAARFTLRVTHLAGTESGLTPLDLSWEYWGEQAGSEGEDWRRFDLRADGTGGLSQSGEIELAKGEGEIKEREINGVANRWIRCRLAQSIPRVERRRLPQLDRITFLLASEGTGLPADLAFHNDTPLDFPGLPFGHEPRLLDTFYLSHKEVFSKKKAQVMIDVKLDPAEILAEPAAAVSGGNIHLFARGPGRKLVEIVVDRNNPGPFTFESHEDPPETELDPNAIPSAVTNVAGDRIFVFVKAGNGHLFERFFNGVQWQWIDLELPDDVDEIRYAPSAILQPDGRPTVFVVASNGELYSLALNPYNGLRGSQQWTSINKPANVDLSASPFAVSMEGGAGAVKVFATGVNGNTYVWDGASNVWDLLDDAGGNPRAAEHARPFAQLWWDGKTFHAKVYVRDADGRLQEYDTESGTWDDLGTPAAGVRVESDPDGFIKSLGQVEEQRHVFVRGSDHRLWEKGEGAIWLARERPGGSNLRLSPQVLAHHVGDPTNQPFLTVFSASSKNSIVDFRVGIEDYEGRAEGGPKGTILLAESESSADGAYDNRFFLQIMSGPGTDELVRRIVLYGGKDRVATVDREWSDVPNSGSTYRLMEEVETGDCVRGSSKNIELKPASAAAPGMMIEIVGGPGVGQVRRIQSMSGSTAEVDPPWQAPPDQPDKSSQYRVLRIRSEEQARDGAEGNIILANRASGVDDAYKDLFVEITGGTGAGQPRRRIVSYSGHARVARVASSWDPHPDDTSDYEITVPSFWLEYTDPDVEELRPQISWEYWNGRGWVVLKVEDTTRKFLFDGKIELTVPEDIAPAEVAGQENYWIRARIIGGDYGRETFALQQQQQAQQLVSSKSGIRPPLIQTLGITYESVEERFPDRCLTFNNLDYLDQTAACRTAEKRFAPFVGLEDDRRALYLGFDKAFDGGPVRIFFPAKELVFREEQKPKLEWRFRANNEWRLLQFEDRTEGLVKQEILELNVPKGFQILSRFGADLYWIKGSLVDGEYAESPVLSGVYPNAVWAFQAETVIDEILGSSDGEPRQRFQFLKFPVREGQEIRVREVLSEDEREELKGVRGEKAVHEVRDEQGKLLETWVLWSEVRSFFDSDGSARHYTIDRATGELQFGDGGHGRIPPVGTDNIRAFSYQAGGGVSGNVGPGEVATLATAVAGVESVISLVTAGGGADSATVEEMLTIGPAQISHRGRAVTPEDFEWLAREASRELAKVRCLPNTNQRGERERGWVTVAIVPKSDDREPMPSLELREKVGRYLEARCHAGVTGRVVISPPEYVRVSVLADVVVDSIDVASRVEAVVRRRMEEFLHPLRGGPRGDGWEFGREVSASDIHVLIEGIDGVDHVERLDLSLNTVRDTNVTRIPPNFLIASGDHTVNVSALVGG